MLPEMQESGDLEKTDALIARGVSVDAKGVDNWRGLHFAARKGHLAVVFVFQDLVRVEHKIFEGHAAGAARG